MLSINIPVYNIEVRELVLELANQAEKLNIPFEIRIYDDGSRLQIKKENQKLAQNSSVVYKELESNVGRAAIRNKLGNEAKYKYLVFIDGDSKIINKNYLKAYLNVTETNCVLCGGTIYQPQKPNEPEKWLRWEYGRKREAISAEKRNSAKGFIITSNNFFIEKKVFERVHFREDLKDYGHEDTLLGYDLFKENIKIKHINNPAEHTGLESAEEFLEKTGAALKNLKIISEEWLNEDSVFAGQVGFLRKYKKVTHWIPMALFKFIFKAGRKFLKRNLTGKNPKLFWFDLYKISYYSSIKNR